MNEIKQMKKLLCDGEALAEVTAEGYYRPGYCIVPDNVETDRMDIAGCLEETLHRLLDEKCRVDDLGLTEHSFFSETEEEVVRSFLLADKDDKKDENEDEITEIDLGYRIHGPMTSFHRIPLTAVGLENKLYERYKLLWMLDQGITLQDAFSEWRDYCDPANGMESGTSNEDAFYDWEQNAGFSGSLYVCFDEFVGAEYQMGDERLIASCSEEIAWRLDQPDHSFNSVKE